jgi:hypothetical protein
MKPFQQYFTYVVLPMGVTFALLVAGGGLLLWSRFYVDPIQMAYGDYKDVSEAVITLAEAECVKVTEEIKLLRKMLNTLPTN